MKTSESLKELAGALAKAQAAMHNPGKNKSNPAFKGSKYADLAAIVEAVKPALAANGLAYIQLPVTTDKQEVGICTRLLHSSGEWVEETYFVPVGKNDAQGFGSAMTYARRYSLAALCGVAADDDDDGNAAAVTPVSRGMTESAIADFKAVMDAATTDKELRLARKAAWEAADFQMDTKAHDIFKEYARQLAEKKFPDAVKTT